MEKIRKDLSFGSNIRALREKSKLTQDQVAAKLQLYGLDVTRSTYSKYETGRLNIRVREIVALRSIFECEYADFFEGLAIDQTERTRDK